MTDDTRDPGIGSWPGAEAHATVGGPVRPVATDGGGADEAVSDGRTRGERQ